jgi:LytS/YehU family sensor histidine kinase
MIEDLADFLRATLSTDPTEDIPLSRELELQSLYLAIEARRFPKRLTVEIDVSDEAARALVPSLVTQPLAENVVRHAVAQTRNRVLLRVVGRKVAEQLHLVVYNSRPDGVPRPGGTGVGLTNVAERLNARFGDAALFDASTQADGGYAVSISLPFVAAP